MRNSFCFFSSSYRIERRTHSNDSSQRQLICCLPLHRSQHSEVSVEGKRTVCMTALCFSHHRIHRISFHLCGHQSVIHPLLLHQLAVSAQFHDFPFIEAGNDVCVPDGGQPVGNNDGGSTKSHLQTFVHYKTFSLTNLYLSLT